MNSYQKYFSACLLALLTQAAFAQSAPTLGTASSFAVLGGAGVTCTNSTITGVEGSLLTVTPTPTCNIIGPIHQGTPTAIQAFNDFTLAYEQLGAITCPADGAHNLSGDLGGKVLSPGVYCISGVGLLTGTLTLDGPSDGIWIFKAATSITPINGSVVMAGGGQACNVYWHTGTAVALDGTTKFLGTILAGSAVTFTGVGSSLRGRALAKTAVTTTGATISDCAPPPGPPQPEPLLLLDVTLNLPLAATLDNPCTPEPEAIAFTGSTALAQRVWLLPNGNLRLQFAENTAMSGVNTLGGLPGGPPYAVSGTSVQDLEFAPLSFSVLQHKKVVREGAADNFHSVLVLAFDPQNLRIQVNLEPACDDGMP